MEAVNERRALVRKRNQTQVAVHFYEENVMISSHAQRLGGREAPNTSPVVNGTWALTLLPITTRTYELLVNSLPKWSWRVTNIELLSSPKGCYRLLSCNNFPALRENSEKLPIGGELSVLPSWDGRHHDSRPEQPI
jgi:hypothetical protein